MATNGKTTTKTIQIPATARVNGQNIKAMYRVSEITNRTNKNLWVVYEAGNESNGLLFSMVHNRDTVRNAMSKIVGTNIQNIRSRRVSTFRRNA
jgi:hypothetical protein